MSARTWHISRISSRGCAIVMNSKNKQCKICGYWKVYNSEKKAEKIFALFDKVRNCVAENIIKGSSRVQLVKKLRGEVKLFMNY